MKIDKKFVAMLILFLLILGPLIRTGIVWAADDKATPQELSTYSAAWWQWSLSLPTAVNPLTINDEKEAAAYCGIGQHGPVWFLGGTLDGTPAQRQCAIPADKLIFFPILNGECSVIEKNGKTVVELQTCAKAMIDHVQVATLAVTVDGKALPDLGKIRAQSPLFTFTLPKADVLGLYGQHPNPSSAIADGYWVLLPPLAKGVHTIKWHGEAVFPDFTFAQDITYRVTIVEPLSR